MSKNEETEITFVIEEDEEEDEEFIIYPGKIYKIWSKLTDKIYIGSTILKTLGERLSKHKWDFDNRYNGSYVSSFDIFEFGDVQISLIEDYPCGSKRELELREGFYQRKYKNLCVNKQIAGRTSRQYRLDRKEFFDDYDKQYYKNNIERITAYKKEYHKKNADKIRQRSKDWYDAHKKTDEYKNKQKARYAKNKEKLQKAGHEIIDCMCGATVKKSSLHSHKKSKAHVNYCKENNIKFYESKITCECGDIITSSSILAHKRSTKHAKACKALGIEVKIAAKKKCEVCGGQHADNVKAANRHAKSARHQKALGIEQPSVNCGCNSVYLDNKRAKTRHENGKKHQLWLENQ
jgi:hypothetical protein